MKKILKPIGIISILVFSLLQVGSIFAQEIVGNSSLNPSGVQSGELSNCFDVYKFQSIGVTAGADQSKYKPYDIVDISGEVVNNNPYPVTNISVKARILKNHPNPVEKRAQYITVDELFVVKDINLKPNEKYQLRYAYSVPGNAPSGDYVVQYYVYNQDRFNLSGLSFTEDIIANKTNFSVEGGSQNIYLDSTNITVNGQPHDTRGFMVQIQNNDQVPVKIPLVNPSNTEKEMEINYKLYKWDGLLESNLVENKTQSKVVPAEGKIDLEYLVETKSDPVYYVVITAKGFGEKEESTIKDKSLAYIRFSMQDNNRPRINWVGLDKNPFQKNEEVKLMTCVHNTAYSIDNGPVRVQSIVKNARGKELTSAKYEGVMVPSISGISNKFKAKQNTDTVSIETSLYNANNELVDSLTTTYNCKDLSPELCGKGSLTTDMFYVALGFGLGAIILGILFNKYRKNKKINIYMKNIINKILIFLTIFVLTIFIFNEDVRAYNAGPVTGSIEVVCDDGKQCGSDIGNLQLVGYRGNVGISVLSRPFNFIRSDNGANLLQNAQVPVGSNLTFSSYGSASGTWWISGGGYDTPDMNGIRYAIKGARTDLNPDWRSDWGIGVNSPSTTDPVSITGGGTVSCTGRVCRANSVGSGSITLTFSGGDVLANSRPKNADQNVLCKGGGNKYDCGVDYERISYGSQTFTYNFTVYQTTNSRPVTSCQGVDNINYTSVRVKFTYSDADGDIQGGGRIELSNLNDTSFTAPIRIESFNSAIRDYTVSNLTPGTSYNYRIRVNDGKAAGNWANCGTFQTKVNQPPTLTYVNTTNISYTTATANWRYSDPDGDPQLRYELKVTTLDGREDFNSIVSSSTTNAAITGLRPGTTYIPRIRVFNNPNGWTGWVTGPQFTTLVNNPPNLDQLSCGAVSGSADYDRAKLSWNYTGTDEPGDQLILKLRRKRTDESNWSVINLPSNRTGERIITNLVSGYTYNVEVSLNDNVNSYLGDRWKGCGTVTPPNYPVPNVDFSLNSGTLTAQKGGTLTVKSGDPVNASWNVSNAEGVSSCSVNTTGGDSVNLLRGSGFSGSANAIAPTNLQDLTYQVRLTCNGKPALQVRNVSEIINLRVESYPTVSCSIAGNQKSVSEEINSLNLNVSVGNAPTYNWEVGKYVGDPNPRKESGTTIPSPITLNYTTFDFGKYSPWVKATRAGTTRTTEKSCGTITNFGDRTIREVNP